MTGAVMVMTVAVTTPFILQLSALFGGSCMKTGKGQTHTRAHMDDVSVYILFSAEEGVKWHEETRYVCEEQVHTSLKVP